MSWQDEFRNWTWLEAFRNLGIRRTMPVFLAEYPEAFGLLACAAFGMGWLVGMVGMACGLAIR